MSIMGIVIAMAAGFALFGCIGGQFVASDLDEANGFAD